MAKKYYVFRKCGQDEGDVALLTPAQADRIQAKIDALITDGDDPYYIYEMDFTTAAKLQKFLDEELLAKETDND